MVQTQYLSDQKQGPPQLRHGTSAVHSSFRRRKLTQGLRDIGHKSPIPSSPNRYHHVTLYVDRKGRIQSDCSSTITHEESLRIVHAAMPKYREAVERIQADESSVPFATKVEEPARVSGSGLQGRVAGDSRVPASVHIGSNTQSIKRPKKRPRSSSEDRSSYVQDDNSSPDTEPSISGGTVEDQSNLVGIEIQDSERLKEYLFDAFTSFQQINCRTLCKSWIRMIEPKKQVNHPYNGNLKVKGLQKFPSNELSTQKDSDPEETKPRWWPSREDCPHKEPDHIKKEQRLALLCHILMNTRNLHECSTDDLRQAITSDRGKIKPIEKEAILQDVWQIGRQLERFKDGEIDATTMVYVNARKEEARMTRGGGRSRKPFDAKDESEDEESGDEADLEADEVKSLTPTTPTPLISSVQYANAEQASIVPPGRLDDCGYGGNPAAHHFRPPEVKHNYPDHQAEYPMPADVSTTMVEISHHDSAGHIFNNESFPENSFGDMQDLRSHGDIFSPDGQQMMGHWAISATPELYPMHYTGEPSQAPAICPADGGQLFPHYNYEGPHKSLYRANVHGYAADSNRGHFPAGYEDDLDRFQQTSTCSFPSHSTRRLHSASVVHQHSYDLPSHIRT